MSGIRKSLLIHSANLISSVRTSDFEVPTITTVALTKIRIDPSDKVVRTENNNEQQLSSLMFFDIKNSRPKNQTFEKDQKIVFDNQEFVITTIEKLYDGKKLHHLEIGLV